MLERQLFERRDVTHALCFVARRAKEIYAITSRSCAPRIALRLPAEVAAGHALIGPHRDDLEIHLDGREIRVYGSSGQQRSALLLLDLAAISLYNSSANDHPVFIIDDVDAELDEGRIRHLLEYLENRTRPSLQPQSGVMLKVSFQGRMYMKSRTEKSEAVRPELTQLRLIRSLPRSVYQISSIGE